MTDTPSTGAALQVEVSAAALASRPELTGPGVSAGPRLSQPDYLSQESECRTDIFTKPWNLLLSHLELL